MYILDISPAFSLDINAVSSLLILGVNSELPVCRVGKTRMLLIPTMYWRKTENKEMLCKLPKLDF